MTINRPLVRQEINQGMQAHKSGDVKQAWLHFQAALREDEANTTALMWLAFLAQGYDKRRFFLERVLAIEPNNKRARDGLAWLKREHAQEKSVPRPQTNTPISTTITEPKVTTNQPNDQRIESEPPVPDELARFNRNLKKATNTGQLKDLAKKGTIAQRARRRIGPLLILLLFGAAIAAFMGWVNGLNKAEPKTTSSITQMEAGLFQTSDGLKAILALAQGRPQGSYSNVKGIQNVQVMPDRPEPLSELPIITKPLKASPTPGPTATPKPTETPLPTATPSPPTATPIPLAYQPKSATEKWIQVDLSEQTLTAWEGSTPVMNFTVSTGLAHTPTLVGQFRIYQKYVATRMIGPGYNLPGVPFTMYYDRGYALHGAYWHNNFGQPMSRGCVNLSPEDAEKVFKWAGPVVPAGASQASASQNNPGTLVVVHQ